MKKLIALMLIASFSGAVIAQQAPANAHVLNKNKVEKKHHHHRHHHKAAERK